MYTEKHYQRVRAALSSLIQASLDTQKAFPELKERYDALMYVDSYCTVKFGGPRRMGHTTSMIKVGKKMFENPAFFCLSEDMTKRLSLDHDLSKKQLYSSASNIETKLSGTRHDAVFVDCAFYVPPSRLNLLKNYVGGMTRFYDEVCLILIG